MVKYGEMPEGNIEYHNDTLTKKKLRITDAEILLVLLAFCEKNIVRYVVLVVSMIPVLSFISELIVPMAYIVLFAFYIIQKKGRLNTGVIELLIPTFVILAIIVTAIFYPQNMPYILDDNNFWHEIFPCLRYYLVGLIFIADKNRMELLGKISCVAIIVETLFIIAYMIPRGLVELDDMNRAYQILPNVLFALNYAINSKKILPWVFSIVGIVYVLSMGTRGPFLIIGTFVVLKLLNSITGVNKKKRILLIVLVIIFFVLFSTNILNPVWEFFLNLLSKMGMSTRTVDMLIDGSFINNMTGRDELFSIGLQMIRDNPLLGYGVYGEWPVISWNIHNMYLELLLHFGVFVGGGLLVWMVVTILRSYCHNSNEYAKDLIIMWFSLVFVRGIFGGSYLSFGMFFLLGFCVKEIKRKKRIQR